MALQGSAADNTLFLTIAGEAVNDVAPTDIVVTYRKSGQTAFTTKIMDGTNWINLANGYYSLIFSPADMDTVGDFTFIVTSAKFDNPQFAQFQVVPAPQAGVIMAPQTCVVSGSLKVSAG